MPKTAGIYIHIPFCERKCTYCNFNTTDFDSALSADYVQAVVAEIVHTGERLSLDSHKLAADTIFFGGGTPSIITAEQIRSLICACNDSFNMAADSEVTIEINPGTLEPGKLRDWKSAGINRASVGVQSFRDDELVKLSRTHSASQATATVAALRNAGFNNISLDLIAGLPEQSLEDWRFNLNEALRIRPEHLSLYLLEIKEGTQLFAQIKRNQRARPDDDLAGEMYTMICEAAGEAGYEQYEISNFALQTVEPSESPFRSKHNLKYWTGAPFYGMGCGAHSYDGRSRWVNIAKTENYIEAVMTTGRGIAEQHDLSNEDNAAEALFMGLRLNEGISLDAFSADYGVSVIETYGPELERLSESGLVEIEPGRLKLTHRGRLLSNEVFVTFV